jgi:hypothetical protein
VRERGEKRRGHLPIFVAVGRPQALAAAAIDC